MINRDDLQDDIGSDNDWAQLESLIEYLEAYEHGTPVKDDTQQLRQPFQLWNSY